MKWVLKKIFQCQQQRMNLYLVNRQIIVDSEIKTFLWYEWEWLFQNVVVKKRRKIILQKDEIWVDYDVVNKRKLILPPEYYLDIAKLEKLYFETPHKVPLKIQEVMKMNFRKILDDRYDVK